MPRGQKRIDIQEVAMEYKNSSKRHKGSISFGNLFCQKADQNSNGFNLKKCTNWFTEYSSAEDHGIIGPEGIEKFCKDIGVDPEDVVMLVLAWKMGAQNMGYFTSQEWLRGLSDLQCDNISKLQCKLESLRSLLNDPAVFKIVYRYGFDFARDKEQRCLEIEVAKSLLSLLLSKSWLLHSSFQAYLDQSKYKVLNRDQWCNVLEFSRTIHPDLHNYDEDGAWPVLLDEYVEWLKNARTQQQWTL